MQHRLARATRFWGVAFNAAAVEEMLARFERGESLTDSDRARCGIISKFFGNAMNGFLWTKALIEDVVPPECRDCDLDDFRFAVRILPEDVKDPGAELVQCRTLADAFAGGTADPSMVVPMREVAQRIQKYAQSMATELRRGLF